MISLALAMRALPEKATGQVIFGFSSSLFLFHLVAQGNIYPESFSPPGTIHSSTACLPGCRCSQPPVLPFPRRGHSLIKKTSSFYPNPQPPAAIQYKFLLLVNNQSPNGHLIFTNVFTIDFIIIVILKKYSLHCVVIITSVFAEISA